MVICKSCGKENPDGTEVCESCGASLADTEAQNEANPENEASVEKMNESGQQISEQTSDEKSTKKGKGLIISVVAILAVALIALGVFLAFKLCGKSTVDVLADAIDKSFKESENCLVTASVGIGDTKISVDANIEYSDDKLSLSASTFGTDMLLYDGIVSLRSDNTIISAYDISEDLNKALDEADKNDKFDEQMLRDLYDTISSVTATDNTDVPSIDSKLDVEKTVEVINGIITDLKSDSYLKENMGLAKEENGSQTTYLVKFNAYDYLSNIVSRLEGSVKDSDMYNSVVSALESYKDEFSFDITISFVIDDGCFTSFGAEASYDGTPVSISLSFSSFDKAAINSELAGSITENAKELLDGNKSYTLYNSDATSTLG